MFGLRFKNTAGLLHCCYQYLLGTSCLTEGITCHVHHVQQYQIFQSSQVKEERHNRTVVVYQWEML